MENQPCAKSIPAGYPLLDSLNTGLKLMFKNIPTRYIAVSLLFTFTVLLSCNRRCDQISFPDQDLSPYILPYPPGKSYSLFQGYCEAPGHRNRLAYDFKMPFGAQITNSRRGVVIELLNDFDDDDHRAGHNNRVLIRHDDGSIAWYGHLKKASVRVSLGDSVDYGKIIGLCGTSGRSGNAAHLGRSPRVR